MAMDLSALDLTFIILYFLLVFFVAVWRTKRASEEEFLIAGRKVGILGTLSSINATKTGSIILLFTAILYAYGFSAIWYFIGVAAGYLLFIPFATKLHKYHGEAHYTLADYFFEKYGQLTGKCASILNIFIMLAWLVLNLIASSKVLSFFTGLSFLSSTIIVSLFVLAYLLLGGFKAVVTTDIIQYGAIVVILFVFAFFLAGGTTIPIGEWNLGAAGLKNIAGFFLLGILIPFSAPELWQRVYASKNISIMRKGIFYSVIVYLVVAFLLALVGLAVKTQFPSIDPDTALIYGFANLLPAGLAGLAVVIFFAAFMSSIDTYAYTAASSFTHDFFKKCTKKQLVRIIKLTMTAVIAFSATIAVLVQDLLLGGYMFAGYAIVLAIPVIATWIRPKIKSTTLNTAIIFGTVLLTLMIIKHAIAGTLSPTIVLIAISGSIVGLILGAIISFFKK
jgi:SSS family solute:Na+ symporter